MQLASSTMPPAETPSVKPDVICGNCDRKLGRLETAASYRGQTVCAACFRLLTQSSVAAPHEVASSSLPGSYYPAPPERRKINQVPAILLTCFGFLAAVVAERFIPDADPMLGLKPPEWAQPVLVIGCGVTVIGIIWFIVNRIRKD